MPTTTRTLIQTKVVKANGTTRLPGPSLHVMSTCAHNRHVQIVPTQLRHGPPLPSVFDMIFTRVCWAVDYCYCYPMSGEWYQINQINL